MKELTTKQLEQKDFTNEEIIKAMMRNMGCSQSYATEIVRRELERKNEKK